MAIGDTVQDKYTGTDVFNRLRGLFQESQDDKGANGGELNQLPHIPKGPTHARF